MIFSLDVRKARKGDCLILHFGTVDDPGLILIDGGPSQVYKPFLRPRIEKIRQERGLSKSEALPVDAVMVSHIDDDHIKGILELTAELRDAKQTSKPKLVNAATIWHNSFDKIINNDPHKLRDDVEASFGASVFIDPDDEEMDEQALMVLASVSQGYALRDDAKYLNIPLNDHFDQMLVRADDNLGDVDFDKSLTLTVVGPLQEELLKLQQEHDKYLKQLKEKGVKAALAAYDDKSVANLSSIVFIAKAGDRTMLLTGDARGDKIIEGLKRAGAFDDDNKLHVDILKMPHHGSDRNMEPEFLEQITADHYIFSGNGEHGNPERRVIEWLRDARGDDDYTIHLTYPLDEIDAAHEAEWNKERAKRINRGKPPGDEWSPEDHGLVALFAADAKLESRLKIVDPNSHVIDLLDPLGY